MISRPDLDNIIYFFFGDRYKRNGDIREGKPRKN